MDAAVLTAYGWEDLLPKCQCQFILDYEDEEDDDNEGKSRKRKKPYRYRWSDDVRDEVLARLLKLNAERSAEEQNRDEKGTITKPSRPEQVRVKERSYGLPQGDLLPSSQPDLL